MGEADKTSVSLEIRISHPRLNVNDKSSSLALLSTAATNQGVKEKKTQSAIWGRAIYREASGSP